MNPWEFDPATNTQLIAFIGQIPSEAFELQNQGSDPMTIKSVKLTGDSAFTLVSPAPAGADGGLLTMLPPYPQEVGVLEFYFQPTEKKFYQATITVTTDAVNDGGIATLSITGVGCTPPDGGCAAFSRPDAG